MLKTAGRESWNPALNHCENFALNLSWTGFKKALNFLTKKAAGTMKYNFTLDPMIVQIFAYYSFFVALHIFR
jgi:hypothetical protein